jgi:hypothetical protein
LQWKHPFGPPPAARGSLARHHGVERCERQSFSESSRQGPGPI